MLQSIFRVSKLLKLKETTLISSKINLCALLLVYYEFESLCAFLKTIRQKVFEWVKTFKASPYHKKSCYNIIFVLSSNVSSNP